MGAPYPAPLPLPHPEDTKPPLGRLLTERGLLTLEQLEEALSEKETSAARLGEILLGHGWLSEADIARALADQHDLEYLDLARVDLECREAYEPDEEERKELGLEHGFGLTLYRPQGCIACAGTGYAGRVALYEVLNVHGHIRRHIEATTEEIFAAAVEDGMTTLRQDGLRLVLEGISSLDEVRRVTGDRLQ